MKVLLLTYLASCWSEILETVINEVISLFSVSTYLCNYDAMVSYKNNVILKIF